MTLTLERRVELGKKIEELLFFISSEIQEKVEELPSNFQVEQSIERILIYDKLISELQKRLPPKDVILHEELSLQQVLKFEQIAMPFGIHKETPIKDVPYEYLCNLFDPNPFMKKLKLYLEYCSKNRYRT